MKPAPFEAAGGAAMLSLPEVLRVLGVGRSVAYALMLAGLLPRPVKLGRASRWPADEVLALKAAMLRDDDEGSRRALVRALTLRRRGASLALAN